MFKDIVLTNRSYRRFDASRKITKEELYELIDLARCTPSARNAQPLKYIISNTEEKNALIFPTLSWAGALTDWDGPEKDEQPVAYIIILGDNEIFKKVPYDHSIAAQTILLGAVEKGLGGCMVGAVNFPALRKNLDIDERYELMLVIALGKPAEKVVLEDIDKDGSTKYYRDENDVHHVPKRKLEDIILDF